MSRKPRIHYPGGLYHVIVRGNNRDYVFNQDYCKEEYLIRLKKYIVRYEATVYGYVVMDNHVHIMIEVSDTPLSKIMQLIQQTYTAWYNRKFKRTGHVYEQRYKSLLINKDQYLLGLIRYIHQNPVRAGMSDINYKYSSHMEYTEGIRDICDTSFISSVLAPNGKDRLIKYLRFMNITDSKFVSKDPYHLTPTLKEIKSKVNEIFYEKVSFDEILSGFEKENNIKIEILKGKYKKGLIKELRDLFIVETIGYKSISQTELAEFLGVSKYTISRVYNQKQYE